MTSPDDTAHPPCPDHWELSRHLVLIDACHRRLWQAICASRMLAAAHDADGDDIAGVAWLLEDTLRLVAADFDELAGLWPRPAADL